MPDFPNQVNTVPAIGVEGDFASSNPRFSTLSGPGGFVAGPSGVTIGRFCWYYGSSFDPDNTPQQVSNSLSGAQPSGGTSVVGLVGRHQQGLITTYLTASGMLIPAGFAVTPFNGGDFLVKNTGTGAAILGMKAYANLSSGAVTFAATGSPTTGSCTGSIGPQTVSFTGSISGNVLTVSAVSSGTIVAGAVLTGGTGTATNTTVVSQLSGTTGGVGTYAVNIPEQTVASASLTGSYGLLNVSAITSGTLGVGNTLTGSGVTVGTYISQLGTGAGGLGTYYVSPTQTEGSITVTFALNVETKWIAMSGGLAGELVKISDHALG
jgi:hypothetical protein